MEGNNNDEQFSGTRLAKSYFQSRLIEFGSKALTFAAMILFIWSFFMETKLERIIAHISMTALLLASLIIFARQYLFYKKNVEGEIKKSVTGEKVLKVRNTIVLTILISIIIFTIIAFVIMFIT